MTSQAVTSQPVVQFVNEETERVRVLLVDDEYIVRYGLKTICEMTPGLKVVGEADNGRDAIEQVAVLRPDVVLMDIDMPVLDGVSATAAICQMSDQSSNSGQSLDSGPLSDRDSTQLSVDAESVIVDSMDTKVLILTAYEDDEHLVSAMLKGASGYLLKNTPPEDFARIILSTHKGYLQIGPTLVQKLRQQIQPVTAEEDKNQFCKAQRLGKLSKQAIEKGITPRENEVLTLIAEGASNKEISQMLHIAEKTVKNHVSSLLGRVGVRDRTQLAIWKTRVGV